MEPADLLRHASDVCDRLQLTIGVWAATLGLSDIWRQLQERDVTA